MSSHVEREGLAPQHGEREGDEAGEKERGRANGMASANANAKNPDGAGGDQGTKAQTDGHQETDDPGYETSGVERPGNAALPKVEVDSSAGDLQVQEDVAAEAALGKAGEVEKKEKMERTEADGEDDGEREIERKKVRLKVKWPRR